MSARLRELCCPGATNSVQTIKPERHSLDLASAGSGDVNDLPSAISRRWARRAVVRLELLSIGLRTAANGAFNFGNTGEVRRGDRSAVGGHDSRAGTRWALHAVRRAGCAQGGPGVLTGTQWDDANIARYSVAMGFDTMASGICPSPWPWGAFQWRAGMPALRWAITGGPRTHTGGQSAVALGDQTSAAGDSSHNAGLQGRHDTRGRRLLRLRPIRSHRITRSLSFAPNEFVVRAAGGVGFYTNSTTTTGVGAGRRTASSWASLSDANAKENFRDVAPARTCWRSSPRCPSRSGTTRRRTLRSVTWGRRRRSSGRPSAWATFRWRINTIDADGVTLAAVKALEVRTLEIFKRIQTRTTYCAARLTRLEALLQEEVRPSCPCRLVSLSLWFLRSPAHPRWCPKAGGATPGHLPVAVAAVLQCPDREPSPSRVACTTSTASTTSAAPPQRALLVGLATPNPDGTHRPGPQHRDRAGRTRRAGRRAHHAGRGGSGSWTDSAGNAGTFAFGGASCGQSPPKTATKGEISPRPSSSCIRTAASGPRRPSTPAPSRRRAPARA